MTPRLASLLACAALTACVLGPWTPPPRDGAVGDARDGALDARDGDASDARDAPDVCPPGMTACDGVCTNLQSDTQHCGTCTRTCALPHANAVCVRGACAVSVCEPTLANCDGIDANGCETDLTSNVSRCGTCSTACSSSGGTPQCAGGRCAITCSTGLGDCNTNPSDGCETSLSSTANCGACGAVCAPPNAVPTCSSGRCAVLVCMSGFADCDGNAANGCEVNTRTDALNCGRCTNACALANATAVCASGACAIGACAAGFANCDTAASNGCEVNTSTSLSHCGACNRTCSVPSATAACVMGACTLATCAANMANCDMQPDNGCEASLRTDRTNCGACGTVCQTTPNTPSNTCSTGVCRPTCATGFADCDANPANGCEASLSATATCGSCTNTCAPGLSCLASGSTFTCTGTCGEPGLSCCGGTACVSGSTCSSGTCCRAPQTACGGVCFDLATATNHCGTCATVCTSGIGTSSTACVAGACVPVCAANYGDCDGNLANGCETNLQRTENHCGSCSISCSPLQRCAMSACVAL